MTKGASESPAHLPAARGHDPSKRGQTSVSRVLLASGSARIVTLPVTGVANLVIARWVTQAVGVEQFGEVMLISTLSQLVVFADLGAGAAVATARAQMRADPASTERFHRTLLTALRTVLVRLPR